MSKLIYVEEKLFYDSYKWEKASYIAYISRVKKNIPFEEAILQWKLERNLKRLKEKWDKYRNDDYSSRHRSRKTGPKESDVCFNCGKLGHWANECHLPKSTK